MHNLPFKAALRSRLFLFGITLLEAIPCLIAGEKPSLLTFQEPHMGTQFTVRISCPSEQTTAARDAAKAAFHEIKNLDQICSDYLSDSELIKFLEAPVGQPTAVSLPLFDVFERSRHFSELTDGAFDITIGPMIRQWRLTRQHHRLPTPQQIQEARAKSGWRLLALDSSAHTATLTETGMRISLGGIAKGYAADKALSILRTHGFPRSLVAASGDIAAGEAPWGERAWRIGIQSLDVFLIGSDDGARPLTEVITLQNAAVSTSGDTRQAIEIDGIRYSHIIDPRSGLGLTERIGVTVRGPDATTTDALATAISVMGLEKGLRFLESRRELEGLIISANGESHPTTGWEEAKNPVATPGAKP